MNYHRFLVAIIVALLAAGCGKSYKMKPSEREQPSPWPHVRLDQQATGAMTEAEFSGTLNKCWETSSNDKPSGPLSLQHGNLVYSGTRKKLKFYNAATGRYLGAYKSGFAVQSGVIVPDSIAYYGTAPYRNKLYAVNLRKRSRLWEHEVRNIASGLLHYNDLVIGAGAAGRVFALKDSDGVPEWEYEVEDRFIAGPSRNQNMLYQPSDFGRIYYLRATDGRLGCTARLTAGIAGQVAVGEFVFACDVQGNVGAFNRTDCETEWKRTLDAPIWGAPALADGILYIGTTAGTVWALDASDGRDLWRVDLEEVIKGGVIVVGEFVIAATMRGNLLAIKRSDGSIASRAHIHGAIDQSPVSDGTRIFVATQKGKIAAFGNCTTTDN